MLPDFRPSKFSHYPSRPPTQSFCHFSTWFCPEEEKRYQSSPAGCTEEQRAIIINVLLIINIIIIIIIAIIFVHTPWLSHHHHHQCSSASHLVALNDMVGSLGSSSMHISADTAVPPMHNGTHHNTCSHSVKYNFEKVYPTRWPLNSLVQFTISSSVDYPTK